MTRATYRAWKCRQGVHRSALTHYCRDCGVYLDPSIWRIRPDGAWTTGEMSRDQVVKMLETWRRIATNGATL